MVEPAEGQDADPILGDERVSWRRLMEWVVKDCPAGSPRPCVREETRRCYEVALYPDETIVHRLCEMDDPNASQTIWSYFPPPTSFSPYAADAANHPQYGVRYRYIVRACEGELCSDWGPKTPDGDQDYVEILGVDYACFGSEQGARCEKRCYAGAKKMFPEIPDCSDPF
jgi:hypothetical protein